MDQKVLSVGERLTIRMIANQLKEVYGEGCLQNELINGCYQLLASHAVLAERLEEFTYQLRRACQEVNIPVAETGPLAASKVKDMAERLKALESAWLECEGIHAKGLQPTIKGVEALITERDTLAERLKAVEAERDHQWKMAFEKSFNDPVLSFKRNALRTPEEFVKEIERLLLKYTKKVCEALEAERDTLKAEVERWKEFAVAAKPVTQHLIDERDNLKAENVALKEALQTAYTFIGEHRHGEARAVLFAALRLYKKETSAKEQP